MKHKLFLFLALIGMMLPQVAFAYDFAVNGIYYKISGNNAEVTFKNLDYNSYSGSVIIPSTVTYSGITYNVKSIGNYAFRDCSSLTAITIPNSVTSIGNYAFMNCSSLPIIDNIRYADCCAIEAVDKSLATYTIKEGTKFIGSYAFKECSNLTSITIPNSVMSIGIGSFYGCTSLPVINNIRYADCCAIEAVDKSLATYTIKEGTKFIGCSAFDLCNVLTSVTIPNSVTNIGQYAFYGCSSLTSVTIPNSVTSIGNYAFRECSGLISVTIPNSVTSIGYACFYNCSGLTSVTIPNSITSLEDHTFHGCSGLTSVTIPNSVTSIGSYAFSYCSGLTSITIPNSVTSIGENAFWECSGLTSVTIGNNVASIGSKAFEGCSGVKELIYADGCTTALRTYLTSITSVMIPNSVTSIEDYAFRDCTGLTTVMMKATTPPTYGNKAFAYIDISNATLTVPIGCVLTYKKADVWGDFGTITDGEVQFPKITITGESTQSTITVKLDYDKEKCVPFEEIGVKIGGTYYKANSKGIAKLENLESGREYYVYTYAKYGGEYYDILNYSVGISTKPINPKIVMSNFMANSASIRGAYDMGDAHIYKTTFEVSSSNDDYKIKEQVSKNNKFTVTGLAPNTKYSIIYKVHYHYGEGDKWSSYSSITENFTTAELKMTTLNPKNVSSTSSVVAAEANISDEETGSGFEWRKYDAPESLPSSKGSAIVYNGRMEGKINNLQPVYYNVRPYYESASGKMFYGEWTTFDPTDFSYFEPTVHTYDMIEDPSSNSVEVRGYVMQGTDDVTEQGFEYWKTGGSSRRLIASNGEVMRVQATGQMMIATLKDLDYESEYVVRAYVMTASGTTYGEERTFTTPIDPTLGIGEVKESESVSRSIKGIYTLDGRKIERITTPGIYLYNGKKKMFKASQLPVE